MPSLQPPTSEQVDAAVARLGKPGANAYFFDNLRNPQWIAPLAERGFFKRPPEPQRNETTISFPDWPELLFLRRMATQAPEVVGKVVIAIPDTENARVRQTLVEIGTRLPRKFSKSLGLRTLKWLEDAFLRSHFGEPVPLLIVHLAEIGEVKLAIELARSLFRASEDDHGQSRSMLDGWLFERYLNICLPTLKERAGINVLHILQELLVSALKPRSEHTAEDYSYIWRANILQPNFSGKNARDVLIDALRDSAVEFVRNKQIELEQACRLLLAPGRPLLKRIALYVASQTASKDDPIVMELLRDLSLVDRPSTHAEYAMLLQSAFPQLPIDDRESLEKLLTSDPVQSIPIEVRQEADAEKLARIGKQVQRDRLLAFGSALPESLTTARDALLHEIGDPPERQLVVTAFSPGSPLSAEQIQALSVEELANYARTWVPSNEFNTPQPEGLARAIGDAVKSRVQEFAEHADIWIGQDPTYVRWVITAFGDALRNKAVIKSWPPLLRLADWAATQEDSDPKGVEDPWADRDTTWRWTRQSVARLVDSVLQHTDSWPEFRYRQDLWKVLACLLRDVDPSLQDESTRDGDPLDISINATRGIATHALMHYLWWVREHAENIERFTLDAAPEVKDAFERALSDPHPAILSAFGEWFRQLYFIDSRWTRAHLDAIFPVDDSRLAFWRASWRTFMDYSQPYDPAFDVLSSRYALGVARLVAAPESEAERKGEGGLGRHLGAYFWRNVGGDATRALLLSYFDRCSPQGAGDTVFFLGRGLAMEKQVSASTAGALKDLWEALQARSVHWPEQKRAEVLRHFGYWFQSPHLPADWRLRQLEALLIAGSGVVDTEAVLAELSTLSNAYPREVARCLRLVLLDRQQGWYPSQWQRESTAVLEKLLGSSDESTRHQTLEIINALVERGNLAARDIARRTKLQW